MGKLKILQGLKNHRLKKKLSIVKNAELSGVGRNFIRDVENGKPTVEFGKVKQYAESIGLKIVLVPQGNTEFDELRDVIENLMERNPSLAQRVISGLSDEDKERLNSRFVMTKKQIKSVALKF